MNAVDCHIHWFPPEYYELLSRRSDEPRTERAGGGWRYIRGARSFTLVPEWTSLETQLETAAKTELEMTVISSMGIHSDLEGLPVAEAREGARLVNEAWADAQRRHPGQFFAAAAIPLIDTEAAIQELDHAIGTLDLRGVSMPGTVAGEPVDAERLEPFYARVEELGVPLFLHPTDGPLFEAMDGYGGAVYRSLGRVVDSSVAILRMVLSGLFDRHPGLRVLHFHAGGVLPFAAGRLDKNARLSTLQRAPTDYLREHMWVDTAMPYAPAIAMAIDFYGADRMLYGSDNPCWNPLAALEATRSLDLPDARLRAVLDENVRGLVDLRVPTRA